MMTRGCGGALRSSYALSTITCYLLRWLPIALAVTQEGWHPPSDLNFFKRSDWHRSA